MSIAETASVPAPRGADAPLAKKRVRRRSSSLLGVFGLSALIVILGLATSDEFATEIGLPGGQKPPSGDTENRAGMQSTALTLFPSREHWIVKDGEFVEINLEAVVRSYLESGRLEYEGRTQGVDVSIQARKNDIDWFRAQFVFSGNGVPRWLAGRRTSANDAARIRSALAASRRPLQVFAWSDQAQGAARVVRALQQQGRSYHIINLEEGNNTIVIERESDVPALERVLRGY